MASIAVNARTAIARAVRNHGTDSEEAEQAREAYKVAKVEQSIEDAFEMVTALPNEKDRKRLLKKIKTTATKTI